MSTWCFSLRLVMVHNVEQCVINKMKLRVKKDSQIVSMIHHDSDLSTDEDVHSDEEWRPEIIENTTSSLEQMITEILGETGEGELIVYKFTHFCFFTFLAKTSGDGGGFS